MEKSSNTRIFLESAGETDVHDSGAARRIASEALLRMLEPLAGFVFDSGLSAGDLQSIFRHAAVKSVVARQRERSDRVNISGVAATTGIPRAEISKILKIRPNSPALLSDSQQQSTNRVLSGWHDDPKFTGPDGQPANLKLYGRGASFETLTKKYGRGIPTRAVLDELIRSGTVQVLPNQTVRANAAVAIDRGVSMQAIRAFGDRATELLSTMLGNMRNPESAKFIANISGSCVSSSLLPVLRRDLSVRGADLLANVRETISKRPVQRPSKRAREGAVRVSVTIFCHEAQGDVGRRTTNKRQNFRRER